MYTTSSPAYNDPTQYGLRLRRISQYVLDLVEPLDTSDRSGSSNYIDDPKKHSERILKELRKAGVSWFGISTSEAQHLPSVMHQDEPLGGVVYGKSEDGFAMLIATDRRVIFLDKKPFFTNIDEVNYDVISGVKLSKSGLGCTVILHTRIRDYKVRTFNRKCATGFVEYIESRCLEHHDESIWNRSKYTDKEGQSTLESKTGA